MEAKLFRGTALYGVCTVSDSGRAPPDVIRVGYLVFVRQADGTYLQATEATVAVRDLLAPDAPVS